MGNLLAMNRPGKLRVYCLIFEKMASFCELTFSKMGVVLLRSVRDSVLKTHTVSDLYIED